jgi:hypothetical protein
MRILKEDEVIDMIEKVMPIARPTSKSEFDGYSDEGIWFRGSEDIHSDGIAIFNYWADDKGCHPKLNKILEDAGWMWEPYDSGTMMAYPS